MVLRCAIVDDEPLAIGLLESYANKTPVSTTRRKILQRCSGNERIAWRGS